MDSQYLKCLSSVQMCSKKIIIMFLVKINYYSSSHKKSFQVPSFIIPNASPNFYKESLSTYMYNLYIHIFTIYYINEVFIFPWLSNDLTKWLLYCHLLRLHTDRVNSRKLTLWVVTFFNFKIQRICFTNNPLNRNTYMYKIVNIKW